MIKEREASIASKSPAKRDAHASIPNFEKIRAEIYGHTMSVVAPLDFVAVRNIWMIGYLVRLVRASFISPIPNMMAIEKAMAKDPLMIIAFTIL